MGHIRFLVGMREFTKGTEKELGEKFAPFEQSIQKLTMAYEIIAFDRLEQAGHGLETKELIRDAEEFPNKDIQEYPHRAPFKLNDEERRILGNLARIMKLPFHPEQREYSYLDLVPQRDRYREEARNAWGARQARQNAIDAGILKERRKIEEENRRRRVKLVYSSPKPHDPAKQK